MVHMELGCKLKDRHGRLLPLCIVMEKGEYLDKWVQRNNCGMDQFTCMQVCARPCTAVC